LSGLLVEAIFPGEPSVAMAASAPWTQHIRAVIAGSTAGIVSGTLGALTGIGGAVISTPLLNIIGRMSHHHGTISYILFSNGVCVRWRGCCSGFKPSVLFVDLLCKGIGSYCVGFSFSFQFLLISEIERYFRTRVEIPNAILIFNTVCLLVAFTSFTMFCDKNA
jgi:hypothetical protein